MRILSRLFGSKQEERFVDDRRFAKRYDALLKLKYFDPQSNSQGESITKNISRNGLRFRIDKKIPKGHIVELEIENPNSHRSLSSKAKVIWLKEFVAGNNAGDLTYEVGVKLLKKRLF